MPELIVAVVALVLGLALAVEVYRLRRKLTGVPPSGDLFDALREIDSDLTKAEKAISELRPAVDRLEQRMPHAVRYTGVVVYDAYDNMAGNLSRSIALLSEEGTGLVLTIHVGRVDSRFYTKMVHHGKGVEELSPEEREAVKLAMARE